MVISESIRKSVVFLAFQMADGRMKFVGTGFLFGRCLTPGTGPRTIQVGGYHLVTARHVIDGVKKLGVDKVFIRINRLAGDCVWVPVRLSDWLVHGDPDVDVAMVPFGVVEGWDLQGIVNESLFCPQAIVHHEIGLGEEVVVVGLLAQHRGKRRNIPIVRVGHLAAFDEEPVITVGGKAIEAYLIDAQSSAGLSGSPVFLNLGQLRRVRGQLVMPQGREPNLLLLGLIHGHYSAEGDVPSDDRRPVSNSGIAIVVPARKIMELYEIASPLGVPPLQLSFVVLTDEMASSPFLGEPPPLIVRSPANPVSEA